MIVPLPPLKGTLKIQVATILPSFLEAQRVLGGSLMDDSSKAVILIILNKDSFSKLFVGWDDAL